MLRASVSLSRKISRDYNSAGYTVTLDGEIPHPTDDAEAVLERVSELFHLAEEALAVEIDRDQGEQAIGRRDDEPRNSPSPAPTNGQPKAAGRSESLPINRPDYSNGQTQTKGTSSFVDSATPKQQQYLQNLGKRKGLSRDDLDAVIAQMVGSPKKAAELTKREAGAVIDHLTNLEPEASK